MLEFLPEFLLNKFGGKCISYKGSLVFTAEIMMQRFQVYECLFSPLTLLSPPGHLFPCYKTSSTEHLHKHLYRCMGISLAKSPWWFSIISKSPGLHSNEISVALIKQHGVIWDVYIACCLHNKPSSPEGQGLHIHDIYMIYTLNYLFSNTYTQSTFFFFHYSDSICSLYYGQCLHMMLNICAAVP